MNHRQLEAFVAVMRTGTASRAGAILGVTQPAVSRALAELERSVGFALFARVQNRLVPTPEGRQFFAEVEASFLGVDTLRAAAARIRDRGQGVLRIGSLSALGSSLVPKAVGRFHGAHPDIAVTVIVAASRDIRDGVASGAFDIGLAAEEIDLTGIVHQPFLAPEALCALPAGHRLAGRATITPADLDGEPYVAYVPEDRARQRLDRVLAEAGSAPRVVVETIYAATVCALVSEGLGFGFVSSYAAGGMDLSRLVLRPFAPPVPIRTLLLLPPDRPKSRLVRELIDALMASR